MRIKRPKSTAREPEVPPEVRDKLFDLIRRKVLEVHGLEEYDPVVAMALIACDERIAAEVGTGPSGNPLLGIQVVLKAHGEVARYVHPTVKQVELSGPGGEPLAVRSGLAQEVAELMRVLATGGGVVKP